jgi:hypothetical protein
MSLFSQVALEALTTLIQLLSETQDPAAVLSTAQDHLATLDLKQPLSPAAETQVLRVCLSLAAATARSEDPGLVAQAEGLIRQWTASLGFHSAELAAGLGHVRALGLQAQGQILQVRTRSPALFCFQTIFIVISSFRMNEFVVSFVGCLIAETLIIR